MSGAVKAPTTAQDSGKPAWNALVIVQGVPTTALLLWLLTAGH
jgi:hypothetical protein